MKIFKNKRLNVESYSDFSIKSKKQIVPKSIGGNSGGWAVPNLAQFFCLKIAALSGPKSRWAEPKSL